MRRLSLIILPSVLFLSGCPPQDQGPNGGPSATGNIGTAMTTPPPPPPAPADEPIATIDGATITTRQLDTPLIQAYGLNMLFKLVELELVKREADRMGVTVSQNDINNETQHYVDNVFKDDKKLSDMRDDRDQKAQAGKKAEAAQVSADIHAEQQRLLTQLLEQQKLSRTDFDLAMQTNAYLRLIVTPTVQSKLTDENLQEHFKATYGEKVQVRHIALANLQEVNEAKRRIAGGESFQQVAQEMSRDPNTASVGGEMRPFSRFAPFPQVFKDAAFGLTKPDDISDPVEADGSYHLIQLVNRLAPTAVKYEDVKDSVRQELAETLTQAAIKQLRTQLGQKAIADLKIENPELARQFDAKVHQRDAAIQDRNQVRREIRNDRPAATLPATAPAATASPMIAPAAAATEPTPPSGHAAPATTSTRP